MNMSRKYLRIPDRVSYTEKCVRCSQETKWASVDLSRICPDCDRKEQEESNGFAIQTFI